ncbi:MAG TPA: thioesterase family protein [Gaiellaceae bacterium]|nr:thioesterase family protein [Gaiellaceae bacterium]
MEGFDFVHRETVRFRDVDAMGHVNNAVYLTYVEEARAAFMLGLGLASGRDFPIIIARAEIDFRSPAGFGEEIEVGVRAGRFGTKSFDLEYELRAGGRVVAEAKTVCVAYDYERREAIAVPDEWRERLAA